MATVEDVGQQAREVDAAVNRSVEEARSGEDPEVPGRAAFRRRRAARRTRDENRRETSRRLSPDV